MATSLTTMPAAFNAGTTLRYYRTFAGYATGDIASAKLWLAGPGAATHVDGALQVDGTYLFSLTAVQTAALATGRWRWTERLVDSDGSTVDYATGEVDVTPDISTATANSMLTYEEKAITYIEAALLGRYVDGMESFQLFGRAVARVPHEQLAKELTRLKNIVALRKGMSPFGQPILAKFTGAASDSTGGS